MQDSGTPAELLWAATGVLLQAAIADPDLIQAQIADHNAWPALLAACKSRRSPSAELHAQLVRQLGPSSTGAQGFYAGAAPSVRACPNSVALAKIAKHGRAQHDTAQHAGPVCQQQSASKQHDAGHDALSGAADEGMYPCQQSQHPAQAQAMMLDSQVQCTSDLQQAEHQMAEAGSAGHVAQLITLFLQTQEQDEGSSKVSTFASKQAFDTMLLCYVTHAQEAATVLEAPVCANQKQRQRAQHSMIQHVAEAGVSLPQQACLVSKGCKHDPQAWC